MYIIKTIKDGQSLYLENYGLNKKFGLPVIKLARSITSAKHYESIDDAEMVVNELMGQNFKIYPVCPRYHKEYSGHPAISRKDNKTKICSNCGVQEALFEFMNQIHKK